MARNNKSIIFQVFEFLKSLCAFGQSKHADKAKNGGKPAREKIYSYGTFGTYLRRCCHFAKWARKHYGCKTLDSARQYVAEYLSLRMSEGKSAWTIWSDAAALAKLYQCSCHDFGVELPSRNRADVRLHRQHKEVGHYSYKRNRDSTDWGRGTGMRRCEMLRAEPHMAVLEADGSVWIRDCKGKGGRIRDIPVDPAYAERVLEIAHQAEINGNKRVFPRVNKHIPEHVFRAEYAQQYYNRIARPVSELRRDRTFVTVKGQKRSEVYDCRRERAGTRYDAVAMQEVSLALGHSRLGVVTSYIK